MDEQASIPEGDPDADLAKRFGTRESFAPENPFERTLVAYRDETRRLRLPAPSWSAALWARISAATADQPAGLRLLPLWTRWVAAAAAILLVAFGFWLALREGPSTVLQTTDQIASIALEDGSWVTLRPRSTLTRASSRGYRLEGEGFFHVVRDAKHEFTVRTDHGEVRVFGTRFDVSTWGGETVVFLEEGRVVFEHFSSGALDTLDPGNAIRVTLDRTELEQDTQRGRSYLDWMTRTLVFGARPLSRILAELEHHYGIRVLVPDSIQTQTLSGQITLSSPEESLSDLGIALGGRFEEQPSGDFRLVLD